MTRQRILVSDHRSTRRLTHELHRVSSGLKDDGPLTLASDMTVWNVSDEQVIVREAIVTEDVAGRWNVDDVIRPIYTEAEEALGRKFEYPEM